MSVHPPFTDLRTVQTLVEKERIPLALGAQHCSDEDAGARTGEVSPRMLARLGTPYVIVGHSERRHAVRHGRRHGGVDAPGRPAQRHDAGAAAWGRPRSSATRARPSASWRSRCWPRCQASPPRSVAGLVIAYEPIWAIGTGKAATAVDAEDACVFIRSLVAKVGGDEAAAERSGSSTGAR